SIVADAEEPGRRFFVPIRMTFATPAAALAFRIVEGKVVWELLPELPVAEQDEPVVWLRSMLERGELPSSFVNSQAKELGITKKMLRRARKILKVTIRREGFGEKTVSFWALPADGAAVGAAAEAQVGIPGEARGR